MSIHYRRFEVLIPLRFNNGSAVPDELVAETLSELRARFGAVSVEMQPIVGQWQHAGEIYRDELIRLFVDTEDSPETRQFFFSFKERLKERFQQIEIWVTSHSIDIL